MMLAARLPESHVRSSLWGVRILQSAIKGSRTRSSRIAEVSRTQKPGTRRGGMQTDAKKSLFFVMYCVLIIAGSFDTADAWDEETLSERH